LRKQLTLVDKLMIIAIIVTLAIAFGSAFFPAPRHEVTIKGGTIQ